MRFEKTDEGWKPADEAEWRRQSIEWNLGCLGKLAGLCAGLGAIVAVGMGVVFHVNPVVLALAFLARSWSDILVGAFLLLALGVLWDYMQSMERESSFQEALLDCLNTINARLAAIETALGDRDTATHT